MDIRIVLVTVLAVSIAQADTIYVDANCPTGRTAPGAECGAASCRIGSHGVAKPKSLAVAKCTQTLGMRESARLLDALR
jgi:hypothetical protein